MKNIKTGVDKLVELISSKKRIKLDDAAKELGVGLNVVQEWAEFLEQEGLISIEYTFSKVWLQERKITKDQIMAGTKEVSSEKDAFIRKIDVALKALDSETVGFEDIKKRFLEIQSHIKSEIDTVRTELDELQKFELLKKNIDKDIERQKKEYEATIGKYTDSIKIQEGRYNDLLTQVDKEKKVIESYKQKIDELKGLKSETEKVLNESKESLKNIEKAIAEGSNNISSSEKRLSELKNGANALTAELTTLKTKNINDALKVIQEQSSKTIATQNDLFRKAEEKKNKMIGYGDTGRKIYDGFKGFFTRNIEMEKLVNQIEEDKNDLRKDLDMLKAKVQAFTILVNDKDRKIHMKEIEDALKSYDKRKTGLKGKVDHLIELIKGA
jgi:chromosome segregation ATPase